MVKDSGDAAVNVISVRNKKSYNIAQFADICMCSFVYHPQALHVLSTWLVYIT